MSVGKTAVASDHSGYEMKEYVKELLDQMGIPYTDLGPATGDLPVNYVEYALAVAEKVASGEYENGIAICNDGIGMSIVANKVAGIRCALCYNPYCAVIARQHNDANVLALGRIMDRDGVREILENWFYTEFEGGRHTARMELLRRYEEAHGGKGPGGGTGPGCGEEPKAGTDLQGCVNPLVREE